MARRVFGAAIRYDDVTVRRGGWLTRLSGGAVAPFGHIHFPPTGYSDDFSQAPDAAKVWFIHEMAHVWQHQHGYPVAAKGLWIGLKGGYRGRRAYHYDPREHVGQPLSAFNLEQQAELIAHYFAVNCLAGSTCRAHTVHAPWRPFYDQVLAGFLADPSDATLLPRHTRLPAKTPKRVT